MQGGSPLGVPGRHDRHVFFGCNAEPSYRPDKKGVKTNVFERNNIVTSRCCRIAAIARNFDGCPFLFARSVPRMAALAL
jgi:hypothetical protein